MYALSPSIGYALDRATNRLEQRAEGPVELGPRQRIVADLLAVLILVGAFAAYLAANW